ncbi:MAG: class B sortase, partial [Clostridia bacterium]|nr:class B sortase [Clostridia bacterium]
MAKKKKKNALPAESSAEASVKTQPKIDYSQHNESIAFSLKHMTPDMIEPSPIFDPGAMEAERRSEYFRRGFLILCSLVFIFSLCSIIKTLIEYKRSDDFYAELESTLDSLDGSNTLGIEIPDSPTAPFGTRLSNTEGSNLDNALYERMKTRIVALQQINPDICGWINIPGTQNINYPIVQGTDNDYYLTREFKGGYLAAGSIFLDYRCDRDFNANHNTVIYGHNMQNGLMFSELIS